MSEPGANRYIVAWIALGLVLAGIAIAAIYYLVPVVLHPARETPQPQAVSEPPKPAPASPTTAPVASATSSSTPMDCVVPGPAPAPPRGAVATAADMRLQHDAIQAFVKAMDAFRGCIQDEMTHLPADTDTKTKQTLVTFSNRALDREKELAAQFAEQEKIFNARQPASLLGTPPETPPGK
jgi:hypothetical protein